MSLKITLDRPALAAYIEADPDFKIELNAAILNEVVIKFFSKNAARIIRDADTVLFDKAVTAFREDAYAREQVDIALKKAVVETTWGRAPTLTKEVQEVVQTGVKKALTDIESTLTSAALAKATEVMPAVLDTIDERVEKRLSFKLGEGIERIVDRKVKERLAEVLNGLRVE